MDWAVYVLGRHIPAFNPVNYFPSVAKEQGPVWEWGGVGDI